jgi:hypothetical protein
LSLISVMSYRLCHSLILNILQEWVSFHGVVVVKWRIKMFKTIPVVI